MDNNNNNNNSSSSSKSPFAPAQKYAASSARRLIRRDKDADAQGSAAYDEMRSLMSGWTSDKVGTLSTMNSPPPYEYDDTAAATFSSSSVGYERDPVEWLNRSVPQEDSMMMDDYDNVDDVNDDIDNGRFPLASPPKRAAYTERAATPVMSNSSKKKMRPSSNTPGAGILPETPDADLPVNVQSPWLAQQQQHTTMTGMSSTTATAATASTSRATNGGDVIVARSSFSARGSHHEYHRYHEALLTYLKTKRRIVERIDVEHQTANQGRDSNDLDNDDTMMDIATASDSPDMFASNSSFTAVADSNLVAEESKAEMDYLRALSMLCWDRSNPQDRSMQGAARKEGNFWWLLVCLRELGLAALIWADDAASARQHWNVLQAYMESLAARVHTTPLELVAQLQMGVAGCPIVIQRRQNILGWLEHCFRKVLVAGVTRPRNANVLVDSQLLSREGLPETDRDADLLRSSLALILAGRLEDAKELVRQSGVPWRAAVWGGARPHGYSQTANDVTKAMDQETVGNTRRPVWRRMVWKLSEQLAGDRGASQDEGAIAAILSNNLKNALANQSLRTWEKGLYATCHSIMGRVEDELLHMHNNNRRKMRPAFPGTDYESQEREHLFATSDIASMTEAGAIGVLESAPFEEMRSDDVVTDATAKFLMGRGAIAAFIQDSHKHLEIQDASGLRFLTHLALYLDSLVDCTTPIFLYGLTEWKNDVLLTYLRHLASREDLWHMLVLYASLLPDVTMLEYLPELLIRIESQDERDVVVQQMRELIPTVGTDLFLLRRVVRLVLSEEDATATSANTPTQLDVRKMKAIKWLCVAEDHLGDALICSNILLRSFLLSDKVASAFMFMDDIRPDELEQDLFQANTGMQDTEDDEDDPEHISRVEHAKSEHSAFQSYLEAARAVHEWKEVVAVTDATIMRVDDQLDKSQLNATEADIARSMERRDLVHEKRKASHAVVTAAEKARASLRSVLEHPGGWLLTEDEEIIPGTEDMVRRSELQGLRVKLLPDCVMLYHTVCMSTAAWMSTSLDDCVAKLGGTSESSLAALDDSMDAAASPLSPHYWSGQALELVQLVASDTHKINSACGTSELKELMTKTAEAAVANMLYSTQREKFVSSVP
jgi:nuclear pore complex protein Nup107